MYFQFQSLSPLEILRQISFRSQAHVRSVPPSSPQLRRRKWGETNRVWRGEGGSRHAHNVVTLLSYTTHIAVCCGRSCFVWRERDKQIAFHKTIESTVPRISSTQADMESTCLVLFLFIIAHTAQAHIVPLSGLYISSKHFLTLLKYQENLILLNIPGRSDRGVSSDVADCGSNHILCTSQVFVEEQPRNEIFSGWRRLLLWQRQHLLRWIWAELLSNRKRRIIILPKLMRIQFSKQFSFLKTLPTLKHSRVFAAKTGRAVWRTSRVCPHPGAADGGSTTTRTMWWVDLKRYNSGIVEWSMVMER